MLHSSIMIKRMLMQFSNRASQSTSFDVLFVAAIILFAGIPAQLCTVPPPINSAIEFWVAKNWNCIPCSQPRHDSKKSRIRSIQWLLPAPGIPNKQSRVGSLKLLGCRPRLGSFLALNSVRSASHRAMTDLRKASCSAFGGFEDVRTFCHHAFTLACCILQYA